MGEAPTCSLDLVLRLVRAEGYRAGWTRCVSLLRIAQRDHPEQDAAELLTDTLASIAPHQPVVDLTPRI